jgi:hypothetical protein
MTQTRTFGRRNAPRSPATSGRPIRPSVESDESAPMDRRLLLDWSRYAAIAAVAFLAVVLVRTTYEGEAALTTPATKPAETKCGATLAEFYEMRPGMSYREVRDIVGCEGEVISQMALMGSNHITIQWDSQNTRFGSMTASFRDNSMVSRMQLNLK